MTSFPILTEPALSNDLGIDKNCLLYTSVKGRVTANLFHAQQHFSYGRVRRMVQDILLGGKGLAVFGNGLHVVIDTAVNVGMVVIVGMDMVGQTVMTLSLIHI